MQLDLFTELEVAKRPPGHRVARPKPAKLAPSVEELDLFQVAPRAEAAHLIDGANPVSNVHDTVAATVTFVPIPRAETIERCIEILTSRVIITDNTHIIEPRSGGVFFLPQMQTDTDDGVSGAHHRAIHDFLHWLPPTGAGPVLVVGCPANDKNGESALKHLNLAARFSDRIAFILSDAFAKPSRLRRNHPLHHLVTDEPLAADAFKRRAGCPAL